MQYDQPTPEAYLAHLDEDWRKTTLLGLRELIRSAAPDAEAFMQYKMLAFGAPGNVLFHLNAQKNYVSLYVGDISKVDPQGQWLDGLNIGKGCIRFSKSVNPAQTRIDAFIAEAARRWRDGQNIGC